MATERNVVDFKIHNLTEEQFQELKAQGKIDPNAVYCTPDTTKERLDALEENKQDIATAVNYDNITNCITEIPQDIKLELADGVLTLKAGSKVYVPNGAGTFDTITIKNDITSTASTNGTHLIGFAQQFGNLATYINAVSGTTEPTTLSNGLTWYDTTNNVIKRAWSGSWQASLFSLPLAVITVSNGAITSIDQVFNGFGYIGSTVFALPGVKVLIPNGRNEDGTLKNVEFVNDKIRKNINNGASRDWFAFYHDGTFNRVPSTAFRFDVDKNKFINIADGSGRSMCVCGTTAGDITSFTPKLSFRAVDYNDFEELDNSVVHKTGDETISGVKTFTGSYLQIKNSAGTGGTGVKLIDSGGKGSSELVHYYVSSEQRYYTRLVCRNTAANEYAYVELTMTDSGEVRFGNANLTYMNAPTPAASSNSTDVATTAWVRDLFEALYPVGSLYISTGNSCPLTSIVKKSDGSNSTWTLVAAGKSLWTGNGTTGDGTVRNTPTTGANNTIAQGLPNITGQFVAANSNAASGSGAFSVVKTADGKGWDGTSAMRSTYGFDASKSNSIYGNSTTVQPPAYVVNVWRRTA